MAKSLHSAAGYGSCKEVSRYLKKGVPVDLPDEQGATPLARAARFDHVEVAALLLANGANPALKDREGKTALALAEEIGRGEELLAILRRTTSA